MTEPLTDAYLAEVRERAEKATAGPWRHYENTQGFDWVLADEELDDPALVHPVCVFPACDFSQDCERCAGHPNPNPATARFIAHAREDVPRLLGEIERLKAELTPLQEAMENFLPADGNQTSRPDQSPAGDG